MHVCVWVCTLGQSSSRPSNLLKLTHAAVRDNGATKRTQSLLQSKSLLSARHQHTHTHTSEISHKGLVKSQETDLGDLQKVAGERRTGIGSLQ